MVLVKWLNLCKLGFLICGMETIWLSCHTMGSCEDCMKEGMQTTSSLCIWKLFVWTSLALGKKCLSYRTSNMPQICGLRYSSCYYAIEILKDISRKTCRLAWEILKAWVEWLETDLRSQWIQTLLSKECLLALLRPHLPPSSMGKWRLFNFFPKKQQHPWGEGPSEHRFPKQTVASGVPGQRITHSF